MNLQLITLLGVKIDQDVYEVIMPTSEGEIAVFPDHEALIAVAVSGVVVVRYKKDDIDAQLDHFAISGGIIEVSKNKVRILVDEAAHGDEIVEAEAKAALDRALKMQADAKEQVDIDEAHELVDRHSVRLKVAELRRRHRR